jgi:hypothetical protein
VQNGFLCTTCTESLADDLTKIEAVLAELEVTRTRQDKIGEGGVRSAHGTVLPWKEHASEAYWVLASTVLVWIRLVVEKIGHDPADPVGDDPASWSGWLARHINGLRLLPVAGECADEIGNALDLAQHAIDRPPVLVFVGPCGAALAQPEEDGATECQAELYAHSGADAVACRACGAEHDMGERRTYLMGKARDRLAPIPTISRALSSWMNRQITPAALRGYVFRGRLLRKGVDRRGNDLYRVGDAADVVVEVWRNQTISSRSS